MQLRSTRSVLTVSVVLALTVGALAPVSAFAKGPGPGAGSSDCQADCTSDEIPSQSRTRDGSGLGAETKARGRQGSGNQGSGNQGSGNRAETQGQGYQRLGQGGPAEGARGPENCDECEQLESGILTEDHEAMLLFMADEEKLAHDLYMELGALWGDSIFSRIAQSETRHQEAVRSLLERYEMTDPTATLEPGVFANPQVQALYDELLAKGQISAEEAIQAGVAVELDDLDALANAVDGVTAPDVLHVYENLTRATERHLEAFQRSA